MKGPLNKIAKQAYETAKKKGFWGYPVPHAEDHRVTKLALIHSEVSEALEDFRNGGDVRETHVSLDGKPCGFPSELADVLIRTLDLMHACGIDVDSVVREKMAYNRKRPTMHGGKKF